MTKSRKRNSGVTDDRNADQYEGKTPKQQAFLERATRINRDEGCLFTYKDFPDYTQGNFRQMVYKLSDKIKLEFRSPLGFYRVKGIELPADRRRVTEGGMGVGNNMLPILRMLKEQPPAIHDLKLKFESNNLHEILVAKGETVNPANKGIEFRLYLDPYITAKIWIYPKTVHIDLACSYEPLVYDIRGAIELSGFLGRIYQYLKDQAGVDVNIPSQTKWVVTQYHFGKDGTQGLSGTQYEHTCEDVTGGMVRFYTKKMPDKKIIPRIEQIQTPKTTIDQEIEKMIKQNN